MLLYNLPSVTRRLSAFEIRPYVAHLQASDVRVPETKVSVACPPVQSHPTLILNNFSPVILPEGPQPTIHGGVDRSRHWLLKDGPCIFFQRHEGGAGTDTLCVLPPA